MAEDEEAPTPTMQNNWVEDGKEAHDEEVRVHFHLNFLGSVEADLQIHLQVFIVL